MFHSPTGKASRALDNHFEEIIPGMNSPLAHGNISSNFIMDDPLPTGPVEVSRVSVKIPPFWCNNPALWFKQVESQFITSEITSDSTKFHTIVGSIDASVLSEFNKNFHQHWLWAQSRTLVKIKFENCAF
uniref:DUF7041 domain-containing protein n=1 Tax=Stomoxys calcitrans TaxID=35570 RepID=A0A1I8PRS2_STOCA